MIITAFDRIGPALRALRFQGHHRMVRPTLFLRPDLPAGSSGGVLGRADDITKVKGVLLAPFGH